ncbi:UPF0481 protein At3g47200-like [Prosopis cineraria]|uniref:UPF0481 protein At3g47200-like n=1 Tax=Prosopis cineraria TaxID=364024 RepID=UPI00240FAF0C|nr:UPF0481 protein At3g47200-like [Prosopis cineraria]XP_054779940.1 UPF0481 protein At3g47200-like [Prosopis cineraria]XP_054779941.1 UPF0481 protein At3g47200-like [Prosopis cineraria]
MASCKSSSPIHRMFSHIINIDKKPEDLNTSECYIYRVPFSLRNVNKEAYTPQLISIGPLHFGDQNLNPMQLQKQRYFCNFWDRVKNESAMNAYKEYLEVEAKKKSMHRCYADKFPSITEEKFVEIILLDSVFIMELLLMMKKPEISHTDDIILTQTWMNKGIQRDLFLLENQIPLFILDKLYTTVVPDSDRHGKFIELAYDYFKCFHPYKKSKVEKPKRCQEDCSLRFGLAQHNWKNEPKHFTDMIRYFYIYENLTQREKGSSSNLLRTATKLQEAGVSFEKVFDKNLLDIQFKKLTILSWFLCLGCIPKFTCFKARLQIPQLKIDSTTECVLRNLIAFEQCHYANQPYICNYVSFIDSLIHTTDDVDLLVEKEVIIHELGSDKEVATLVNSLCKQVVVDKTCYKDLINDLNGHYQNEWYRTMASLRLVYFRDAWRASSTLVAIAVLVFTIFNFCRVVRLVLDLDQIKGDPN